MKISIYILLAHIMNHASDLRGLHETPLTAPSLRTTSLERGRWCRAAAAEFFKGKQFQK